MSKLESTIKELQDLEEIRRLKHYYYCMCVDRGVGLGDQDALAQTVSHFTDDIVADFTGFPLTRGKEAVGEFFTQTVPSLLTWCQHRVMNDVITIDGDTATGEWYVDCPAVFRAGNPTGAEGSAFIAGRYKEAYVREDGVWKWSRITAFLDVMNPFEVNWAGAKFLDKNS